MFACGVSSGKGQRCDRVDDDFGMTDTTDGMIDPFFFFFFFSRARSSETSAEGTGWWSGWENGGSVGDWREAGRVLQMHEAQRGGGYGILDNH